MLRFKKWAWPAKATFGARWFIPAPGLVGTLGQTRLPRGPGGETQPAAEDGVWSLGVGNRRPSDRRPSQYHRWGQCHDEPLQPVCKEEARDPLCVPLSKAVKQTILGGHSSTSIQQIATALGRDERKKERCVYGGNADIPTPPMCRGDVWHRRNTLSRKRLTRTTKKKDLQFRLQPLSLERESHEPSFGRHPSLRRQDQEPFAQHDAMLRTRGYCLCPNRSISTVLNICPRVAKEDGIGTLGKSGSKSAGIARVGGSGL